MDVAPENNYYDCTNTTEMYPYGRKTLGNRNPRERT